MATDSQKIDFLGLLKNMKILELFSGSGSIGDAFRSKRWEVVSLDLDPKTEADIHEDILKWDHTACPVGEFDAIWASP